MSDRGRGVTRRPFSGKDKSNQNRRTRHSFLGKQTEADQRAQFPSVNAGQSQPSVSQPPTAPSYQGSPWLRPFISSRTQQSGQPSTNIADQTVSMSRNANNWRNRYKEWKDIGSRYRRVQDSLQTWTDFIFKQLAPLPPDELEEFRKHGIEFGKMLGQGGYGSVWEVTKTKNYQDGTQLPVPKKYACKIMNLYNFQQEGGGVIFKTNPKVSLTHAVDRLMAEASIHRKLLHRNIVKCENVITIADPKTDFPYIRLLLFMELCQGDLRHLLSEKPSRKFTESEILDMFKDVSTGLKYLHDRNICHFDIKTNNIMYVQEDSGGRICYKLADFGLSEQIDSGTAHDKEALGTLVYMAPEMFDASLRGNVFNPKATDIYSLGCVLAEAMVGVKLWPHFVKELFEGNRPETDIFNDYGVPPLCGQLIVWMTRYKADERPTIDEVLKHAWIKSI